MRLQLGAWQADDLADLRTGWSGRLEAHQRLWRPGL